MYVAAVWWTVALVGGSLGRPSHAAEAMRPPHRGPKATAIPYLANPARAALARLASSPSPRSPGGLGFVFPACRRDGRWLRSRRGADAAHGEGAVSAIEERDGVRFYVEPGSALQPVTLIRTPGLRRDRPPPGTSAPSSRRRLGGRGRSAWAAASAFDISTWAWLSRVRIRTSVATKPSARWRRPGRRSGIPRSARSGRSMPGRHHIVGTRGGDRREDCQSERPADLLRGVDQPAGESLFALLDSGDGGDRRGDEAEPETDRREQRRARGCRSGSRRPPTWLNQTSPTG